MTDPVDSDRPRTAVVSATFGSRRAQESAQETAESSSSQRVLTELRAAMEDYLDQGGASELNDHSVIESERAFAKRYGFAWGPRARRALIRLQHELDLTVREIRLFHRTGNLVLRPNDQIALTSNRYLAALGWLQISLALIPYGTLLAVALFMVQSVLQGAVLVGMTIGLFAIAWSFHWVYVRPWIIQKRVHPNPAPDRLQLFFCRAFARWRIGRA